MTQDAEIEAALAEAGFRRMAHVRASHRVSDVVASRPDVGIVLLRCVDKPTSSDIEEAAAMVAAGDFDVAVVAYNAAIASELKPVASVRLCSLDDLSHLLMRLTPHGNTEAPH